MLHARAVLGALTAFVGFVASQTPASAADLGLISKAPVFLNRWDGLYASVSAGAAWQRANTVESEQSSSFATNNTTDPMGTVIGQNTFSTNSNLSSTTNGNATGAVFVFAMGYNVVFANQYLIGVQSEVSRDLISDRLLGTNATSSSSVSTQTIPLGPSSVSNATSTGVTEFKLTNNWTISEMARIGVLVTRDTLVYGLIGWSISGFELDDNRQGAVNAPRIGIGVPLPANSLTNSVIPFTLNGITYGAGIEHDFGWLRAFLQFKGINYNSKDIVTPIASNTTQNSPGFSSVTTTGGTNVKTVSANNYFLTAGVTVPINFSR